MGQSEAATLNWLTQNLKGHCSAFVTQPGFNSLYPWSGLRPPTGYNNGAWMILVNNEEQEKTVRQMRETSRPCAVYNPGSPFGWTSQPLAGRPLVDYIMGLQPVARHAGYELRAPVELAATWQLTYLQSGTRSYPETPPSPVPAQSVNAPSLRLWFRAMRGSAGTLVGFQSTTIQQVPPNGWCPLIYLGLDGRLRAEMWNETLTPITTADRVDDRQWHHVVLVKTPEVQRLYLDGALVGEISGAPRADWATFMQLGTGYTGLWPQTNNSWFPFRGELRDVVVASEPWEPDDVSRDYLHSRRADNSELPLD
jgi:hypothetical protein